MSAIIGLLVTVIALLFYQGYQRIRTPGYEAYLAPFGGNIGLERPNTRYERWVRPLALWFSDNLGFLRVFTDFQKVAKQLDYAGNPRGMTPREFYGVQVYGGLAGLLVGFLWLQLGLPFGVAALVLLPLFGYAYPAMWLKGKVKRRQQAISVSLPDLLDMLAVCVSAGMGFDIALGLLVERSKGALYEEMERLMRELRIGEPRHLAFRHVIERNSSKELRAFIEALLQAEDLGTPIAATLERQAEDMRIMRRHRLREQGAKANNQIALVMVFLIMPSIMCLVLGGIVLSFFQGSGGEIFSTPAE
ncbi:MAG: type II secretion system F family protein [Chloroflexaceae bacterium]|nr:type II secretion system F family protein [Chloroflexaceae bacterium]